MYLLVKQFHRNYGNLKGKKKKEERDHPFSTYAKFLTPWLDQAMSGICELQAKTRSRKIIIFQMTEVIYNSPKTLEPVIKLQNFSLSLPYFFS